MHDAPSDMITAGRMDEVIRQTSTFSCLRIMWQVFGVSLLLQLFLRRQGLQLRPAYPRHIFCPQPCSIFFCSQWRVRGQFGRRNRKLGVAIHVAPLRVSSTARFSRRRTACTTVGRHSQPRLVMTELNYVQCPFGILLSGSVPTAELVQY